MEDKIYQKAFNAGYLIEKHLSALSQLLTKSLSSSTSTFSEGFIAGSNQFIKEKADKDMIVSLFKEHGKIPPLSPSNEPDKDTPDYDR